MTPLRQLLPIPRLQRRSAGAASAGAAALVFGLLAPVPSQAAAVTGSDDAGFGPTTSITLVNGDTLQVRGSAAGKLAVTHAVTDEPWRYANFTDAAGDLHVVPAELLPLIPDRLDPRLFNVSALLRDGYGTRESRAGDAGPADRGMPLIVTYTGAPVAVAGLDVRRLLPSVDGAAVTVTAAGTLASALRVTSAAAFLDGVDKIWLDAPMQATLDESVPQIGAPAAWAQGIDGAGVTIAVVDTGIDDSHPDLAGRVVASELFAEGTETTDDLFGHGTHVASIAAGDGAASGGQFTGVAYGSDLVNAKVLDDFGSGLESWVIAGMEWSAIDEDADIVNLSLSGGPSDGTDLVSQAVDTLSAEEDALFVTAAGNYGGAPGTIETPATADSALAVGAVDKSDVLAYFSAWGPRLGGTGVKPEIVAPGVDITAARADGSELGPPVGDDYMELSGTSMAAPHVAGAAALLLEAHPDWSWAQLKTALVTSAADVGAGTFQQGGGRVDVAAALDQTVRSDLATIDLGALDYPHDDGETSTVDVTLTNDGGAQVVLDLAASATDEAGTPAPQGMLTIDAPELSLDPGEAGTVRVTFDPATGPTGLYGGALTATAAGVEPVHIPLSFQKKPQLVDLDVNLVLRDGAQNMFGMLAVQNVDDIETYFQTFDVDGFDQTVSVEVPLGTYSVNWMSFQDESAFAFDVVTVVEPQVVVDADTELTLDADATNEITVDVGAPVDLQEATLGVYRRAEHHDRYGYQAFFSAGGSDVHAYVNETEKPVTVGDFEFVSAQVLTDGPQRRYDLVFPETDDVPADVAYKVGPDDVATVHDAFHADVDRTYYDGRAFFRPQAMIAFVSLYPIAVPDVREDWVTADDTSWAELIDIGGDTSTAPLDQAPRTYDPGDEVSQSWVASPSRPAEPYLARSGDLMSIYVPPWSDQDDHVGYEAYPYEGDSYDQFHLELVAAGTVVGEAAANYGDFSVPEGPASYRLTLDGARDIDWWRHSTKTSTTWWFSSDTAPVDGERIALPAIDYGIDLGLYNRTEAPNPITFSVAHVRGAPAVTDLSAAWSIDDGATWEPLQLFAAGAGAYDATVPVPSSCDPSCDVSLQVAAAGTDGPLLQQEVIRAYTAEYVAAPPTSPPPTSPPPTSPPPTTISPTATSPSTSPTTTLPGTGGGNAAPLARLGLGLLLLGGVVVAVARRRLARGV